MVFWTGAGADVEGPGDLSQHAFLARNPFALKPPPTNIVADATKPAAVKVDLKLAGITVDPAGKRAWLVIPPSPARPGVPAVTNSSHFAIAEGGRQGDVEVLAIDPKANTVRILNAGIEVTLDFVSNGLAAPPVTAGHAGAPGVPRVVPTPVLPGTAVPASAVPGFKSSAISPGTVLQPPGAAYPGGQLGTATPVPASGLTDTAAALRASPTRSIRTAPETPEAVDPVTQAILMRAQEARERAAGRPFPPLPPIPGMPPTE
jgi:hypothetical protein